MGKTPAEASAWGGLAEGLRNQFPVHFTCGTEDVLSPCLVFGEQEILRHATTLTLPALPVESLENRQETVSVRFSDKMLKPFCGHELRTLVAHRPVPLKPNECEEVLASVDGQPVWTRRASGNVNHYRTTLKLPLLASDKVWSEGFHGGRFLELLPLIVWLREIVGEAQFASPQPRACFIIDDPNLHSDRYGFVDYQAIAKHARENNYHVSFATIPLDGWYASRAAVDVFNTNSDQLSLMIHGNNHTYKELGQNYSETQRIGLAQQAISRIKRLEARTKLEISRVMAPPHGACSEEMLTVLPPNGFIGATISHGSLRSFNKGKTWIQSVGYRPGEWIGGCPVLPRWGINADFTATTLLAAFLGQPLIFMGHHQDLKHGLEWFGRAAAFINSLPKVSWSNIESLFCKSFQSRIVGGVFHVRPWSGKLKVEIPEKTDRLLIDTKGTGENGSWQVRDGANVSLQVQPNRMITWDTRHASQVELVRIHNHEKAAGRPLSPIWPLMRRLLTEGRDRWSGR